MSRESPEIRIRKIREVTPCLPLDKASFSEPFWQGQWGQVNIRTSKFEVDHGEVFLLAVSGEKAARDIVSQEFGKVLGWIWDTDEVAGWELTVWFFLPDGRNIWPFTPPS